MQDLPSFPAFTISRFLVCPIPCSSLTLGSTNHHHYPVLNAAKLGGVTEVSMYASLLQNNKLSPQWMPIPRNHEYPPASVQEQYGAFTAPSTLLVCTLSDREIAERAGRGEGGVNNSIQLLIFILSAAVPTLRICIHSSRRH